jgi:hypothetical protein
VAFAVMVRVGGAVPRGGDGAWEGGGAGRLRGVMVILTMVLVRRWVSRVMCNMRMRIGMVVRMGGVRAVG